MDESSLANDDMKQQLLEEILTMCELRFGHARQTQLHDKFDVLSKYYFVHSQGQKQTTGTVEEQTFFFFPRATVVAPTWPVKNEPRRFRILTKQPQPPALFTVEAKNPKSCMENRGTQTDQPPPKKHPRITKARSAQA